MYIIKLKQDHKQEYFRSCFQAVQNGERGTYMTTASKETAKTFKTRRMAERKIEFLKRKQEENNFMQKCGFEIIEV